MKFNPTITKTGFVMLSIVFLFSLTSQSQEKVNLKKLLPESAIVEITHAYPDFQVFVVPAGKGNTEVMFEDNVLRVDGIEDMETRVRMAKYVLQYMENPNKRVEDRKRREDYEALPPEAKMKQLIARIRKQNPKFEYEWVGYNEGNVKVKYGERGMRILHVENPGAMEEWAHAIVNIQKEIDKTPREKEIRREGPPSELEMHIQC